MAARTAAAAEVGQLTEREVIIAGAITYWCEGAKSKPHRRDDRVSFINSDPALIKFFLRFLEVAGIAREHLIFRIYVHESADTESAQRFWLDVTQAQPGQFRRPTLKRHNAATVRKNVGDDYHGCLRIDVRQSASLYQKIEGWAAAAMAATDDTSWIRPGPAPDNLLPGEDSNLGQGLQRSWSCQLDDPGRFGS